MPIRSGSLSVRRFVIREEIPADFARTATMAIRKNVFRAPDGKRGEKEAMGWVNPRSILETQFTWEDLLYSNLVLLGVRRDRLSFNKTLFRARFDVLLTKVRKERGTEKLSRQHRLALAEQLTNEMLAEASPTSSFTELLWDLNTNEVFIAATGNAICERISELFLGSFDLHISPAFPAHIGYERMMEQGLEDNFDEANAAAAAGLPADEDDDRG